MDTGVPLLVEDSSQVAAARRAALHLAASLGFDQTAAGNVALVVTEIATNILKHGGGGEILLTSVPGGQASGIDVIGLDRGRGLGELDRCLADGYSTAGSPGTGLGAIRRLSAVFEVYSTPGRGTAVLARVPARSRDNGAAASGLLIGAATGARRGEDVCGDGWALDTRDRRSMLLVVDGLGHGLVAAGAATEAIRLFRLHAGRGPADILHALHAGLRSTRGAAVAVTEVDLERSVVRFAGIGNVAACILSPDGRRHLVSHNGTVGHAVRRVDEFAYPWPKDAVLVEHTDGLTSQWSVEAYPGLLSRSPGLIAAMLYRDFRRPHDDATVVVGREAAA